MGEQAEKFFVYGYLDTNKSTVNNWIDAFGRVKRVKVNNSKNFDECLENCVKNNTTEITEKKDTIATTQTDTPPATSPAKPLTRAKSAPSLRTAINVTNAATGRAKKNNQLDDTEIDEKEADEVAAALQKELRNRHRAEIRKSEVEDQQRKMSENAKATQLAEEQPGDND